MKYFKQDDEGKLQEICFRDMLGEKLAEDLDESSPTMIDIDKHHDGSGSWVEIEQINEAKKVQITVAIQFDDEGDDITSINVYKTPVKQIVDSDKTECLI